MLIHSYAAITFISLPERCRSMKAEIVIVFAETDEELAKRMPPKPSFD